MALIAHWNCDENTGTSAADAVGSRTGTLTGAHMGWSAPGRIGTSALDFANDNAGAGHADSYVSVGRFAPFEAAGNNDFSASMWVYTRNTDLNASAGKAFFWYGVPGGNTFLTLMHGRDGEGNFRWVSRDVFGGTVTHQLEAVIGDIAPATWYHVAWTHQSSASVFQEKVYVDSTLITTQSTNGWQEGGATSTLLFGRFSNGSDNSYLDGLMDQIKIYDHTLNQTEVNGLYAEGGAAAIVGAGLTKGLTLNRLSLVG
jgi:hypothetical protein